MCFRKMFLILETGWVLNCTTWIEKTKNKPKISSFRLLKQFILLWHTSVYKHCKYLSAFILSIQSVFPLSPKQLQWAFVQLSIKRPSTVHINLSYSGPETASFHLVILQSGWKGRSKSCLGNIKRQSQWKRVQKINILYCPQDRKRDFPLGRLAPLHFYNMQCLHMSVTKAPWLLHSQFH